jgi:hypothetical protein
MAFFFLPSRNRLARLEIPSNRLLFLPLLPPTSYQLRFHAAALRGDDGGVRGASRACSKLSVSPSAAERSSRTLARSARCCSCCSSAALCSVEFVAHALLALGAGFGSGSACGAVVEPDAVEFSVICRFHSCSGPTTDSMANISRLRLHLNPKPRALSSEPQTRRSVFTSRTLALCRQRF